MTYVNVLFDDGNIKQEILTFPRKKGEIAKAIYSYFPNGSIKTIEIFDNDDQLHNTLNVPAFCENFENTGKVKTIQFFRHGKLHAENRPARTTYNEIGSILREEYYKEGQLYRLDGPAIIEYNPTTGKPITEHYKHHNVMPDGDGVILAYYNDDGELISRVYREGDIIKEV